MADLHMNAMRDTIRGLRTDVEGLRRRTSSGTMLEAVSGMGTANFDGTYALLAGADSIRYSRLGDLVVTVPSYLSVSSVAPLGTTGLWFSLPVTARASLVQSPVGRAVILDSSTGTQTLVDVVVSGSLAYMLLTASTFVTTTSPFTWAAGDQIAIGSLAYEAET